MFEIRMVLKKTQNEDKKMDGKFYENKRAAKGR